MFSCNFKFNPAKTAILAAIWQVFGIGTEIAKVEVKPVRYSVIESAKISAEKSTYKTLQICYPC